MSFLALALTLLVQSVALPALTGRVVDEAGLLTATERAQLTRKLEAIENETSVQFVVVTIPTLGEEALEDFSIRLAEKWKIGQKGLDNGAILLIVPRERKIRIEVGYGLEPVIPDGLAGRIIRERLAPAFREERYYDGIVSAIDGLELAARKEYPETPPEVRGPEGGSDAVALIFAYLVVGILGNAIGILVGVIAGAIVLPVFGGSVATLLGWWAVPVGAFLGLFASLFLRGAGRSGTWTSPGRHGGSGWGGGWSGGGGGGFSGGGGFRGGGGSFGGGGASGSW